MRPVRHLALSLALLLPAAANAAGLKSPSQVESFHYSWRLRGGLSWIAGIVFPRTGFGDLRTTYPASGQSTISSELLITSPAAVEKNSFYTYQSQMDEGGNRTLVTYHAYEWGSRSRKDRTVFDYVMRVAHRHKETPTKVENMVDPLPPAEFRDILTAIYFLRQSSDLIRSPITTTIYSDGKAYPVIFRPVGRAAFAMGTDNIVTKGFEVVGAPGGKRKWPGGVTVWISDDARRIPCRIEISERFLSLQLDLVTVESYALVNP